MKYIIFAGLLLSTLASQSQQWQGTGSIYYNGGNVGINTSVPLEKLQVEGTVKAISILTGKLAYKFNDDFFYDNKWFGHYAFGWGADSWGITPTAWLSAYGGIKMFTQGYPRMSIDINGNVGIGTTSVPASDAKLAVNGVIYSKKIKVTQIGWADYVFQPTYTLRPLSEVEQYIQLHHHLPDVPSAGEIEKSGVDLGDNQATLLKKIEELTLYVIDQNKRLSEQEKKMEVQLKVNEDLNRELELQQRKIDELNSRYNRANTYKIL